MASMTGKRTLRERWNQEPWKSRLERFAEAYPATTFAQFAPDLAGLPHAEEVPDHLDLRGAKLALNVKSDRCSNLDLSWAITHYLVGDPGTGALVEEMGFELSQFTNSRFREAEIYLSVRNTFLDCDFGESKLGDSRIWDSRFERCCLVGTNFRGSKVRDTVFVACDLAEANLGSVALRRVRFEDCNLVGLKFNKTTGFSDVELIGRTACDDALREAIEGRRTDP